MAAASWVRCGWGLGVAVIAATSLPQAGFAEQPLKQLPEDAVSFSLAWVALPQTMVEVTKDHGPLAGVSWGVVKGSSEVVERVLTLLDEDPFERRTQPSRGQEIFAHGDEEQVSWLNLPDAGTRERHREPALLRYTF